MQTKKKKKKRKKKMIFNDVSCHNKYFKVIFYGGVRTIHGNGLREHDWNELQ